jgi:ketosteroid isomerase-like protein
MKRIATLFFACSILTGCNRSLVVDIHAESEAISKIEDGWTTSIISKNIDKIMNIFAQEAVAMNANTQACIGTQAIRKYLESWFADTTIFHNTFESAIDTIEVSASGDLAFVRGNSRISIRIPTGVVKETDKWITIYRKVNDEWKAIVDIWNSDMPISGE